MGCIFSFLGVNFLGSLGVNSYVIVWRVRILFFRIMLIGLWDGGKVMCLFVSFR